MWVVLVIEVANIFMNVSNQSRAVETLLYVFRNQMGMGKKSLTLTMKHRDGYKEFCRGSIDKVFKDEMVGDIEYGDLLLLEHYNDDHRGYIFLNDDISIDVLADIGKKMGDCCYFVLPRGNTFAFFIIKNSPMASYTIYQNDIISDSIFGNTAAILNNVCGKIDHGRGMYAMMKI